MRFWKNMNNKTKRLNAFDIKLIGLASVALGLIIAKLFSGILGLSIWWFVACYVVCIIRPFYLVWIKR